MENIKLPKDATHLTLGFSGDMPKMSPEQRVAMASLNEQAKKRQTEIETFKKETPMETEINTPFKEAHGKDIDVPVTPLIPATEGEVMEKTNPDKCLPDPLLRSTAQVTNYLRYTQATLADEFHRVVDEEIMALRNAGQKEYAHDDSSPFANFERGAKDMGIDRKQVLWVYAMKHKDGIAAHLKGQVSQREDVRGRVNDLIVYLLLLRGMLNEEAGNTGNFGLGDLG